MRLLLVLLMLLLPVAATAGCGQSKPDPRQRPDFVDTSNPDTVGDMMGRPDASGRITDAQGSRAGSGGGAAQQAPSGQQ